MLWTFRRVGGSYLRATLEGRSGAGTGRQPSKTSPTSRVHGALGPPLSLACTP